MVIALGDYMSVKCHACIGGTNVQDGIRKLKEGQHIIVGTPGRVYDMLNRGILGMYKNIPRTVAMGVCWGEGAF